MADPRSIHNVDETGLSTVLSTPLKVIAEKGSKVMNRIQVAERGVLTTVVLCISAVGELLSPFVIFIGKRKDADLVTCSKENNIEMEVTESGYMDSTISVSYTHLTLPTIYSV